MNNDYAVVIRSNMMGYGNDKLGALLMRSYINSLPDLVHLPSVIVLYNTGVHLAVQGADTADSLVKLQSAGVTVLLCGTCVDYFEVGDRLAAGSVSNMVTINNTLTRINKVLYP